jgi:hypothetical protein
VNLGFTFWEFFNGTCPILTVGLKLLQRPELLCNKPLVYNASTFIYVVIWIIYTPNTDHLVCKLFTRMQCVCHVYTKIHCRFLYQLCSWIVCHNIDTWKMQRREDVKFCQLCGTECFLHLGVAFDNQSMWPSPWLDILPMPFLYTLSRWNIVELGIWWTLHFLCFVFFFLSCFRNVHFAFKYVDTYWKLMATIVLFLAVVID